MRIKTKLVYGVGHNDSNYPVTRYDGDMRQSWVCPFYSVWKSMLFRCYHQKGAYFGVVSVSDEWRVFSNFKAWMEKQDWENKELDKDLYGGSGVYSERSCCFISKKMNTFVSSLNTEKPYLSGFYYVKSRKSKNYMCVVSDMSRKSNKRTVGYFCSAEDANKAFWKEKIISAKTFEVTDPNHYKKVMSIVQDKISEVEKFYASQS